MGVYTTLFSPWFIAKLQDYAMFEIRLSTLDVDTYYTSLMDQVFEQKEEIEDNQELIASLGDIALLDALRDMTDKDIQNTISKAFAEACGETPAPEVQKVYENAMRQMALA